MSIIIRQLGSVYYNVPKKVALPFKVPAQAICDEERHNRYEIAVVALGFGLLFGFTALLAYPASLLFPEASSRTDSPLGILIILPAVVATLLVCRPLMNLAEYHAQRVWNIKREQIRPRLAAWFIAQGMDMVRADDYAYRALANVKQEVRPDDNPWHAFRLTLRNRRGVSYLTCHRWIPEDELPQDA